MQKKINIFNTEFKLSVFAVFLLLLLKIFFINDFIIILKTTFIDIIIFAVFFLIFNFYKNLILKILFYLFYVINTFIHSLYYYYFFDISQRGFSLSTINLEAINFVMKHIISFKIIILIIILIGVLIILSIYLFRNIRLFIKTRYVFILILILIILYLISFYIFKIEFNPYTNIIFDLERSFNKVDLDKTNFSENLFIFDKTIKDYNLSENIKYKKILVFVGEEWMFSDFIYNEKKLEDSFFENNKLNSNVYTNYYTTNQDSRTSIYSMLTSYFIPFEAYLGSTYDTYLPIIKEKNNLVDFFNSNNYSTHFVVSSLEIPDIAIPFNWKEVNTLKQSIYDNKEYYCLDIFSYETACEDLSILEDTKKIIKNNENLFLFQEFIYGHSYKYIIDNRQSRTKYYNNYLNEIYSFLEKEDLLDESIIIITGDHGSRARKEMLSKEGYNVPLIVIAKDLNYMEYNNLLSHIDFKDILFNYIFKEENKINNKSIMFVGATNSNLIGFVDDEDNFGIIDVSLNKLINYNDNVNIKMIAEDYLSYYNHIQKEVK